MMKKFLTYLLMLSFLAAFPSFTVISCAEQPLEQTDQKEDEDPSTDEQSPDEEEPEQTPESPEPETPETPGTETPENPDQQEPQTPETDDGIIRVLAIGNSFSQDAVEQYLYELFAADGQQVIIGNLYIGGCTLETHHKLMLSGDGKYAYRKVVDGVKTETGNTALLAGLEDEPWDYVSLQQASGSSGKYETYTPYLPQLLEYVKANVDNPQMKLMFHQTWAYASSSDHGEFPKYDKDQMTMYDAIMSAASNAMKDNPSISMVIPSGTAIQNGRTSYLGDSFNRDGYHLETTYGRYTAACTWYESITGKSVVGNSYAPASVDETEKAVAQNAAHLAVLKPWEVTDMVDFKTPVSGDVKFDSPVYVDFGGGSTTAPDPWVRVASYSIDAPIYLKDGDGSYSPLSITSLDGFTASYNGVGSEPSSEITIGSISYPKSVWSDGIMVSGPAGNGDVGPAKVVIAGFDPQSIYNIVLLAVRFNGSADARISEYVLEGSVKSETYQIYTGLKTFTSVESYESYSVSFNGATSSPEGTFTIFVSGKDTAKAADGHLNALVVSKAE